MVREELKLALLGVGAFFAGAYIARRGVHRCPICPKCKYYALEEKELVDYEKSLGLAKLNLRTIAEKVGARPELIQAGDLESLYREVGVRNGQAVTEALLAISNTQSFRKELVATLLILNNRASLSQKAEALWNFYSTKNVQTLVDDAFLVSVSLPFALTKFTPMRLLEISYRYKQIKTRLDQEVASQFGTGAYAKDLFVQVFSRGAGFVLIPHSTRVWLSDSYRAEPPNKVPVKTNAFDKLRAKSKVT
mmetsp:Transcript_17229/g.31004  ORF Transcript_17229/g.31004 Transcript_17229/m.31004 type:complete len:249 (-) Transcript_17229:124-870(-)